MKIIYTIATLLTSIKLLIKRRLMSRQTDIVPSDNLLVWAPAEHWPLAVDVFVTTNIRWFTAMHAEADLTGVYIVLVYAGSLSNTIIYRDCVNHAEALHRAVRDVASDDYPDMMSIVVIGMSANENGTEEDGGLRAIEWKPELLQQIRVSDLAPGQ